MPAAAEMALPDDELTAPAYDLVMPDADAMQDRFLFAIMVAARRFDTGLLARLKGNTLPISDMTAQQLNLPGRHATTCEQAAAVMLDRMKKAVMRG